MPESQGDIGPQRPSGLLGHTAHLRKGRRGPGSAEYEFDVVNSLEYDTVFMDFRPATMPVDQIGAAGVLAYAETNGGSTDFAKLPPTIARPSDIVATISNDNPSGISLTGVPQFLPEMNPFLEVMFEVQTITNLELVIGFFDAVIATAGDVLGDIDTPAFVGSFTDAVGMCLDTEQTLQTGALVGEDGGSATKVDFAPVTAPFGIPTLATKVIWRIELRDNRAYAFVNGALVAELTSGSASTGVLLAPVLYFGARSAATKLVHIDYIYMGQERADLLV